MRMPRAESNVLLAESAWTNCLQLCSEGTIAASGYRVTWPLTFSSRNGRLQLRTVDVPRGIDETCDDVDSGVLRYRDSTNGFLRRGQRR